MCTIWKDLYGLSATPCTYMETITMTFTSGVSSIFVGLIGPINKTIRFTAQHSVYWSCVSTTDLYLQLRRTNSNELRKIVQYACVLVIGKEQAGVTVTIYDSTRKAPVSNIDQIIGFPHWHFSCFLSSPSNCRIVPGNRLPLPPSQWLPNQQSWSVYAT